MSHEFFHAWNVERIRPASLEPFDFNSTNMSSELWLAEGFTSYYGNLVMARAGLDQDDVVLEIAARRVQDTDALRRLLADHSPGDLVTVRYRRRDGTRGVEDLTLSENPEIHIVPIEQTGTSLSEAQQRFRSDWLGSRPR